MDIDKRIEDAVRQTKVIRSPRQNLYSFGRTNIYYYIVTEPAYSELLQDANETVIREGRVIAEKPQIVTPYYLSRLEGFSPEARQYFEALAEEHGANFQGLFYSYRNEPKELSIVSNNLPSVIEKLNKQIDARNDPLAAIIKGEDELWDVSLMKFIYEVTLSSVPHNMRQLGRRGLLDLDSSGTSADTREKIDKLFERVENGQLEPGELKDELDKWGLFEEYEDRFFSLFWKEQGK
ncbi:hypothetical protein ACFLYN_03535 [Chloroflexota bacterium]